MNIYRFQDLFDKLSEVSSFWTRHIGRIVHTCYRQKSVNTKSQSKGHLFNVFTSWLASFVTAFELIKCLKQFK